MKPSLPRTALMPVGAALALLTSMLAGCGPVKLVAVDTIPPPLIVKIPVQVALRVPPEFAAYVHEEERAGTQWHVEVGKAQTEGITRLMDAMFERVVAVDSVAGATALPGGVQAVLEPALDEFTFVTPRDAGTPYYAVSLKYRMNIYRADGTPADSWAFTGYGSAPSQGLASNEPLAEATALAMRDAGAKLVVEFREQAVLRGLLPRATAESAPVDEQAAPQGNEFPAEATAPTDDERGEQPDPADAVDVPPGDGASAP